MMLERDSPQSLSFCDLPITEAREIAKDIAFGRRPTTPEEEFEFFSSFKGFNVEICSSDDIFFHGKLLPFKSTSPKHNTTTAQGQVWNSLKKDFFNAKGRAISENYVEHRYRRLEKDPTPTRLQTQMTKRVSGCTSGRGGSRPKWYMLMFGSMRAPVEMEMSDIRSRQQRRSPATLVPGRAGDGEERKRTWKWLRFLSCRGHAEVGTPSQL